VPATDNDPLDLEQLEAVRAEYKKFVPFTERVKMYKKRSTAADGVAVSAEEHYRGLHNVAFRNKCSVLQQQWQARNPRRSVQKEWKAPIGTGITNPATGAPFFGHQFEGLDLLTLQKVTPRVYISTVASVTHPSCRPP
jgi:hypothetical protein